VQVTVVTLTDLLPNHWLQALSTDNKNLSECIPFRGDDSKTGWAPGLVWTGGKSRPRPDWILDRPAHSESLYQLSYQSHKCKNIIQRNNVSCWTLLRFQCNWNLRLGCQRRKVKGHLTWTKFNPPSILWDRKLWVVELHCSFRQTWKLVITWHVNCTAWYGI